ncbi:GNAT family N-acetyltransferase [Clostridium algidicarnis]|uniref:GNAT family N-acetyltransferase n=1 Tax=Clostridium algidicarnis TaxID=37659 RepID=UPI001C0C4778|nr:GNAT family N-acetyltransferase [Clostridium algidicarnis]MBU3208386.1 GNAT family N-acetyltransferase [Clostridium algidicarnis]
MSRNLTEYDLYDDYSIEKADWKDFSVYFAVEVFDTIWDGEYEIVPVTKENKRDISKLFVEAFSTIGESQGKTNFEKQNESIESYFDNNPENTLVNKASTLIYEKKTNELVGACLISIWEEWPNVYDIAVKPSFQKKGLAKNMLKRSLTILKKQYPTLRLFVTLGNDAEMVYRKMGFLAGTETTEMILPVL